MKCKSNTIGAWLDNCYAPAGERITIERAQYNAAVEVLEVAGFKIDCVPCGRGMIHVVNPPDRIVRADGREVRVDGLFWDKEA